MKKCLIILSLVLCIAANGQDSVLIFHELAPMPSTPKNGPSTFVIDSDLYVMGGQDSAGYYSKEVWKYHVPTNIWVRMGDFPQGVIYSAGGFTIDGKGYICCGIAQNTSWYQTVWEYLPATDTWNQKNNYSGLSIQPSTCFSYNHKGYLGLGTPGPCNDLSLYDPLLDQWTPLNTLPAPGRFACSNVLVDSFVYIFGGYYINTSGQACHEVWRFNLDSNYWEQMPDMPGTNRGWCATWTIKNLVVCALGTYADTTVVDFQTDKYILNTRTGVWKPIQFQGFLDSVSAGYTFMIGNLGYYYGGVKRITPYFSYRNELFSFDATPLLTTGISETQADVSIHISPNPVSALGTLTVSVPEDGEIRFTDGLGRLLYTTVLHSGPNAILCDELHAQEGIVFYSAQLRHGIANGKVVIVK